jgi:hypothetical protein
MGTAGEGEGKCVGLLVPKLSLACSVFLQMIFLMLYIHIAFVHILSDCLLQYCCGCDV